MNLNKWLCKTFDTDKKGHVTIKDAVYGSSWYSILIAVASIGIYSIYRFLIEGGFNKPNPEPLSWHMWGAFVIVIIGLILSIIASVLAYEGIKYIANIKIAKCPLKENENK